MNLKTNFSIKQIVWLIHDNKLRKANIEEITINVYSHKTEISYVLFISGLSQIRGVTQERLYETKELLIESL